MKTITPFPHAVACPDCRDSKVCNFCGAPDPRCTNGRCMKCHDGVCTPGGLDGPGHGSGLQPGQYSDAHYTHKTETAAKAALRRKVVEAFHNARSDLVHRSVRKILDCLAYESQWHSLDMRLAMLEKLAEEIRTRQEADRAEQERHAGLDVPVQQAK